MVSKVLDLTPMILDPENKMGNDLTQIDVLLEAQKYLAVLQLYRTERRLRTEKLNSRENAWNECMIDLVECAKFHCYYFMSYYFAEAVRQAPEEGGIRQALHILVLLFSLRFLNLYSSRLLETGYCSPQQAEGMRDQIRKLYKDVRKNAVAYVDAFNLPDFVITTPLGCYDGDIYNKYFEYVKEGPGAIGKAPYFDELILPSLSKDLHSSKQTADH